MEQMKIAGLWRQEGDALGLRPDLGRCQDADLKHRVLGFLSGGGLVLHAPVLREDRLDPSQGNAVPLGYASDGEWIWPLEMSYYLERHGLLPEEEFLQHMRERNYEADEPAADALADAARLLTQG